MSAEWWDAFRAWAAGSPTPPDTREAEISSLRASLDDAHREISRLTGEKHARDVALRRVIEAAESVHRPKGERG